MLLRMMTEKIISKVLMSMTEVDVVIFALMRAASTQRSQDCLQ